MSLSIKYRTKSFMQSIDRMSVANSVGSPSRRRFLRNAIVTTCAVATTADYAFAYEPNDLELVKVPVTLPNLPPEARALRIGHLSDMHCDSERSVQRVSRAVRILLDQEPDIVFLTGDYITHNPERWTPECVSALSPLLKAPRGVYAVLGNHDWGQGNDPLRTIFISACLQEAGITVLRNSSIPLPGVPKSHIIGLDDVSCGQQDLEAALKGIDTGDFKLLLVHEPDYADMCPEGFALQFSGHSHGGQIRFPGLPPMHLPTYAAKYYEGLNSSRTHQVYTTRGVGTVGIAARTFCRPEVTLITLV
jgi:predicted MPP superfamily phosphohydrolase